MRKTLSETGIFFYSVVAALQFTPLLLQLFHRRCRCYRQWVVAGVLLPVMNSRRCRCYRLSLSMTTVINLKLLLSPGIFVGTGPCPSGIGTVPTQGPSGDWFMKKSLKFKISCQTSFKNGIWQNLEYWFENRSRTKVQFLNQDFWTKCLIEWMCWFLFCLLAMFTLYQNQFFIWFRFFRLKLLEKKKSEMALKSRKVNK